VIFKRIGLLAIAVTVGLLSSAGRVVGFYGPTGSFLSTVTPSPVGIVPAERTVQVRSTPREALTAAFLCRSLALRTALHPNRARSRSRQEGLPNRLCSPRQPILGRERIL